MPEPLSEEWVKEQIALCARATPGPWAYRKGLGCKEIGPRTGVRSIFGLMYTSGLSNDAKDKANARFVAAASEGYLLVLKELQDFHASFALYSKACRVGQELFLEAHPEFGELTDPDTGEVVAWLVEQVRRRPWAECPRCGSMCLEQDMVSSLCARCAEEES